MTGRAWEGRMDSRLRGNDEWGAGGRLNWMVGVVSGDLRYGQRIRYSHNRPPLSQGGPLLYGVSWTCEGVSGG